MSQKIILCLNWYSVSQGAQYLHGVSGKSLFCDGLPGHISAWYWVVASGYLYEDIFTQDFFLSPYHVHRYLAILFLCSWKSFSSSTLVTRWSEDRVVIRPALCLKRLKLVYNIGLSPFVFFVVWRFGLHNLQSSNDSWQPPFHQKHDLTAQLLDLRGSIYRQHVFTKPKSTYK